MGQVVFAAVDVLCGVPERQLLWDSEGDTLTITMTRLPDDQVSLAMTWTSEKLATSSFAFDLSTVLRQWLGDASQNKGYELLSPSVRSG